MKLNQQLIMLFLIVSLVPIVVVGLLSFNIGQSVIEKNQLNHLETIAELKVEKINTFFEERKADISTAQGYYNIKTNLPVMVEFANGRTNPEYLEAKQILDNQLKVFQNTYKYYVDIMLVSPDGKIVYTTNEQHASKDLDMNLPDPTEKSFEEGKKNIYFSEIFRNPVDNNNFGMLLTAPAYGHEGNFIGVIVLEISMEAVYDFIQDPTGLGETGETLVGKKMTSHEVIFLNPLRHDPEAALERKVEVGSLSAIPIQRATQGRRGSGESIDYRDEPILASWIHISSFDWGLVAKIDKKEAFIPIRTLRNQILIIGIIFVVIVMIIAFYFSRSISKPVVALSGIAKEIGSGQLNKKVEFKIKNEIGDLASSLEEMRINLKKSRMKLVEKTKLEEINQKLEKAYLELKSLDKQKDQFISLISHELKTPLIPIMGYIEMINSGEVGKISPEIKEKLQICYTNAENLRDLINDFLDLSRLDLKRLKLSFADHDLVKLAQQVKENLSHLAKEHQAEIIVQGPKGLVVEIDQLRINQVLTNLVKNAILYGKEKQKNKIEIVLSKTEAEAKIAVKDQGQGISKENIPKLFDRYFRAEQAVRSPTTGTGLGLVITKGILELHGGKIFIKSQKGVGSTFSFTLPLIKRKINKVGQNNKKR